MKKNAITLGLAALALCLGVVAHTRFTADMSAFLPRSPTPEQQLLIDQLKSGAISRVLLIGIEGGDAAARARLSRDLAAAMRKSGAFVADATAKPAASTPTGSSYSATAIC